MLGTTRLPLVAFVLAAGGDAQLARMPAFLNEFAFEQHGADGIIEVAVALEHGSWQPSVPLQDLSLCIYEGASLIHTRRLSNTTVFRPAGGTAGILRFYYYEAPLPQPPFSFAIVCTRGCIHNELERADIVQFLSYGAATRAANGPCVGELPADIGLFEEHVEWFRRTSFGLTGEGMTYEDFHWVTNHGEDTRGSLNEGQVLNYVRATPPAPPGQEGRDPPPPPSPPPVTGDPGTGVPHVTRPRSNCFHAPATPGDRRSVTSRLRVGTFNTGGLFDGIGDADASLWNGGTDCPGYSPPERLCDAAGAAAHIARLQSILLGLHADILNVNEVEDCAILQALVRQQGRNNDGVQAYNAYMEAATQTDQLPVGLITQLDPVVDLTRNVSTAHYPMPNSQCGELVEGDAPSHYYRTVFEVWGMRLALFGLNLPGPPHDPAACSRREAQASIAQSRIRDDLAAGMEVIVCGDLNDFDESVPDQNGNLPRSRVLEILQDLDGDGVDELSNVVSLMDPSERYSGWRDAADLNGVDDGAAEHTQMDHILVSPRIFSHVRDVYIDHSSDATLVAGHWPLMMELRETAELPQGSGAARPASSWSDADKTKLEMEIIASIAVSLACAAGIWRAAAKQRKAAMRWFGFDSIDDLPSSIAMDSGIRSGMSRR